MLPFLTLFQVYHLIMESRFISTKRQVFVLYTQMIANVQWKYINNNQLFIIWLLWPKDDNIVIETCLSKQTQYLWSYMLWISFVYLLTSLSSIFIYQYVRVLFCFLFCLCSIKFIHEKIKKIQFLQNWFRWSWWNCIHNYSPKIATYWLPFLYKFLSGSYR